MQPRQQWQSEGWRLLEVRWLTARPSAGPAVQSLWCFQQSCFVCPASLREVFCERCGRPRAGLLVRPAECGIVRRERCATLESC